jgi:acetylornithine aminotransferase
VNAAVPNVVRLAPPLILGEAETDAFLQVLPGILDSVYAAHGTDETRAGE